MSVLIVDTPRACTKGDLKQGVAVKEDDNGDKKAQGKCVVGFRLMRFVKGVRLAELGLMVLQLFLLLRRQDRELPLLLWVFWVNHSRSINGRVGRGQVVVVMQFRQHILLSPVPSVVVVVSDVDHVIGIHSTEGSQAVTDDGEQSYQDTVDYMDNIDLPSANIDPANEEKYPGKAENRNECCIKGYQEAKCCYALV